jgi:hypothetical protein
MSGERQACIGQTTWKHRCRDHVEHTHCRGFLQNVCFWQIVVFVDGRAPSRMTSREEGSQDSALRVASLREQFNSLGLEVCDIRASAVGQLDTSWRDSHLLESTKGEAAG